jgi:hypothetical protein
MAKATRRERRPQFARVIFYNADLGMISPVVSNDWERPVEWLLQQSGAMFTTNIPDAACARFIGWYLARPGPGESHLGVLGVDNLPVPVWQPHGDGPAVPAGWLERLLTEASSWGPPAVLVQLEAQKITQGGRVLWQGEWGQLAERMAREGCDGPAAAEFAARLRRRAAAFKAADTRKRRAVGRKAAATRKAKQAEPGAAPDRPRD